MAENIIVLSAMPQEGDMTDFNRIKASEQQLVTFKVKKPAAVASQKQKRRLAPRKVPAKGSEKTIPSTWK